VQYLPGEAATILFSPLATQHMRLRVLAYNLYFGGSDRLDAIHTVLAHCNAGLGRTAIFLASVLKGCGYPGDAVEEIRRIYEPDAMRGPNQEAFVRALVFGPNGRP